MNNLLSVEHLKTTFRSRTRTVVAVEDISFHVKYGETLGLVGESGCGKSVTALSIMQLNNKSRSEQSGKIMFDGRNLLELNDEEMRKIRGSQISMIFQEPMTSLNPLFTIGNQMSEVIQLHLKKDKRQAREYSIDMLRKVNITRPEGIIDDYPHTLSGGMQQRVMIAMAFACNPKLLIADEPTTALDVTIQAQILRLMKQLQKDYKMALILITHDFGVVAEMADRVAVVYMGVVMEEADIFTIFDEPKHPYTIGLINSIPRAAVGKKRLVSIPGFLPSVYRQRTGCPFYERCSQAQDICCQKVPSLKQISVNQKVRCWMTDK